jgi:glycine/D-amino acid oxidase-like deaminating enzyme/nitrite reductase/ring-hydroxylating ferredoxin subunit
MNPSGQTTSVWMTVEPTKQFPTLEQDVECDVCVVGAGIAGLTTAYLLAKAGQRVVVLEKFPQVAQGETSRTTAQLVYFTDYTYSQLKKYHGDKIHAIAEAHNTAIDTIERIAREENIACDFRRVPVYLFAPKPEHVKMLDREFEVLQELNASPVRRLDRMPVDGLPPHPCIEIQNLAQIHALKYMYGLAEAVERHGAQIFVSTQVTDFDTAHATLLEGRVGAEGVTIKTENGPVVRARYAVAATNAPGTDVFGVHLRMSAYRTYVVGLRVEKGRLPYAIWWDTLDPYHYVRLVEEDGYDVLISGGEDHHTGRDEDGGANDERFRCLEDWTRHTFPQAGERLFEWSGQVMESYDGIGFNGRHAEGSPLFMITGDTGSGTTNGTLGALLVSDLIHGKENPWEAVFDPSRLRVGALGEMVREAGPMLWQFTDWLTPGDDDPVKPGAGAIVREGLRKVAVYKDENGTEHRLSAICPHLGCIVQWNGVEKTWDCPCHGSRFGATGELLNGPAKNDLEKLSE